MSALLRVTHIYIYVSITPRYSYIYIYISHISICTYAYIYMYKYISKHIYEDLIIYVYNSDQTGRQEVSMSACQHYSAVLMGWW
jgi:hypothetical protein